MFNINQIVRKSVVEKGFPVIYLGVDLSSPGFYLLKGRFSSPLLLLGLLLVQLPVC